MNIKENIIKHYLRNVYFIIGTPYAGKSTMCKMLSEKHQMYHCEENYNSEIIFKTITIEDQPNLSYFQIKESWSHFLNRTPDEYEKWINGNSKDLIGFEIAELIRVAHDQNVIVDTNLPLNVLKQITDYNHVAIMLSKPEVSSERFFDRDDVEKLFLLDEISKCDDPKKTHANFLACIKQVSTNDYKKFKESDYFTLERSKVWTSKEETLEILTNHFKL